MSNVFGIRETIAICKTVEKLFGEKISEDLLCKSLEPIDPNGWSMQWNGAPKLQIYKELIRINREKWKNLRLMILWILI